jgi:hypothetical protein
VRAPLLIFGVRRTGIRFRATSPRAKWGLAEIRWGQEGFVWGEPVLAFPPSRPRRLSCAADGRAYLSVDAREPPNAPGRALQKRGAGARR